MQMINVLILKIKDILFPFLQFISNTCSIVYSSNNTFNKTQSFRSKLAFFWCVFFYNLQISSNIVDKIWKFLANDLSEDEKNNVLQSKFPNHIFDRKNALIAINKLKRNRNEKIKSLLEEGYLDITSLLELDKSFCDHFNKVVMSLPAFNSQTPWDATGKKVPVNMNDTNQYYSFYPDQKELIGFYKKILSNQKLREFLSEYFSQDYFIYSCNTMVCIPSKNLNNVTSIHRDRESFNYLCLFVYWTKTTKNDGATYFEPGSHLTDQKYTGKGIYLEADKGGAFLCNNTAWHSGNINNQTNRIVSWFRFSPSKHFAWYGQKNFLYKEMYDYLLN